MKIKSYLAKPFANIVYKKVQKSMRSALEDQENILAALVKKGKVAEFGKEHRLAEVTDHQSFIQAVPIRDYEKMSPYVAKIKEGKANILWPGKPIYLVLYCHFRQCRFCQWQHDFPLRFSYAGPHWRNPNRQAQRNSQPPHTQLPQKKPAPQF